MLLKCKCRNSYLELFTTKYISFSRCAKNSNHKVLTRILVDYLHELNTYYSVNVSSDFLVKGRK